MSHDFPRSRISAHGPKAKVVKGCLANSCSLTGDFIVNSHTASIRLTEGVNYGTVLLRRGVSVLGRGGLRSCYMLTAAS